MKQYILSLFFALVFIMSSYAQIPQNELADPYPAPSAAWQQINTLRLGWGSTDTRYQRNAVPETYKGLELFAWRGERVNAQAVLLAPQGVNALSFSVSDLKLIANAKKQKGASVKDAKIAADNIKKSFVRYVMADYSNGGDTLLSADALQPAGIGTDATQTLAVPAQTLRPLWMEISVPQSALPGKYQGTLTAHCDGTDLSLPFTLVVADRVLPEPSQWKFHLDLWQNPYAVARYYGVPLWSEEHFAKMRPTMELLASAGQKVITCSIIQHPWNSQTHDPFESMIGKTRHIDGTWTYDYRIFDRWVEFMMSCGITEQIDCYTILPWHLTFEYYNEAENCTRAKRLEPGSKEFEEYLLPLLTDFAAHLKAKGWFKKTCIAIDERPRKQLEGAYKVLRAADPDWRIEGAINYFGPEIAEQMYDISFAYEQPLLTTEQLDMHLSKGNRVTFYTCCGPKRPNTFLCSNPAESTFLGWHAAAAGYNGYLRWAYNSWVREPWLDARFRSWTAGDCFVVYPGGSSVRMQRLIEGIQDYEKIRILRTQLSDDDLRQLNAEVEKFSPVKVGKDVDVETMVNNARQLLRQLSK